MIRKEINNGKLPGCHFCVTFCQFNRDVSAKGSQAFQDKRFDLYGCNSYLIFTGKKSYFKEK
jgi:hypothetical protein